MGMTIKALMLKVAREPGPRLILHISMSKLMENSKWKRIIHIPQEMEIVHQMSMVFMKVNYRIFFSNAFLRHFYMFLWVCNVLLKCYKAAPAHCAQQEWNSLRKWITLNLWNVKSWGLISKWKIAKYFVEIYSICMRNFLWGSCVHNKWICAAWFISPFASWKKGRLKCIQTIWMIIFIIRNNSISGPLDFFSLTFAGGEMFSISCKMAQWITVQAWIE